MQDFRLHVFVAHLTIVKILEIRVQTEQTVKMAHGTTDNIRQIADGTQ